MVTNLPVPYDLYIGDPISRLLTMGLMSVKHSVLIVTALKALSTSRRPLLSCKSMSASSPLCSPSCSLKSKAEWQILQLYCWENYWNFCVCQHQEYWIRSQGQQGFQCKVLEMPEFTENKMFWKYDGNWRITVQKYSQTKRIYLTILCLSTLLYMISWKFKRLA